MERLNEILHELGISKVKLAKFLGVSRQMIYNYLDLDDLNKWPKDKKVLLLNLLGIKSADELDSIKVDTDYILSVETRINSLFANNYKNENKNFIEKLKVILEQIKEETSKTLILLDKEYIKLNDYIVNNLLSKYLKNQKTTEEELINIFQNFEYEIDDDYSYLEKSKATKKLKKKLGKNQ